MASNEQNWIGDTIHAFIHSSVWLSPIQTFIDHHCASFDIDDEGSSSNREENEIYEKYQHLVQSLIDGLAEDLNLDKKTLREFCHQQNSLVTDESYEQFYAANDSNVFKEMMRRKNLILQLQAMVHLQLECGVLKPTATEDDRVLQLLISATKPMEYRSSEQSKQNEKVELRQSKAVEPLQSSTIDAVPEEMLREKLHQLTLNSEETSNNDVHSPSTILSRRDFLKQQRDLIIQKQCEERARALEKESIHQRPQSAVKVAKKAMMSSTPTENNRSQPGLTEDELEKRKLMAAKLRREVVNKR